MPAWARMASGEGLLEICIFGCVSPPTRNISSAALTLYYSLDLAPWEAVLGTRVIVPTLKDQVSVRIPPGTDQGRQLRIRGRGLPIGRTDRQGDLYVVINIELPRQITDEERELWKKLSEISDFNPRKT